jgi:preprotein translocase subunit SecG
LDGFLRLVVLLLLVLLVLALAISLLVLLVQRKQCHLPVGASSANTTPGEEKLPQRRGQ